VPGGVAELMVVEIGAMPADGNVVGDEVVPERREDGAVVIVLERIDEAEFDEDGNDVMADVRDAVEAPEVVV
jgi:hypothetical protein